MKQVKWLLGVLFGAALASSWWAAAMFGQQPVKGMDGNPIWPVPWVLTVLSVIFMVSYVLWHWEEK